MKRLKWSDKLKSGIEGLDEQHETILEDFNKIFDAVEAKNHSEVMILTNRFIAYWELHFRYEEELMRLQKYPQYDTHKSEHENIKNKLSNIKEMHVTGSADLIPTLVALLNFWVESHMESDDNQLYQFLKKECVLN